MLDKPQKTVFVLGAGASKASDFRLPVMEGFLQNLDHHDPRVDQLYFYCERTFPLSFDPKAAYRPFGALSLEDVFTQIELELTSFASIGGAHGSDLAVVRGQLLDYVRSRLHPHDGELRTGCKIHRALLCGENQAKRADSVVSLNYDIIAEASMWNGCDSGRKAVSASYSLLQPPSGVVMLASGSPSYRKRKTGLLLKLHGSVDWTYCPNERCPNHLKFFPARLLEKASMPSDTGICGNCGTTLEWVLVPPTMKKSFETFPKLSLIWRLAHEELKAADRVIFFGVSMAESDYYLHWLIRSSLVYRDPKPGVIVINPCEEALNRTAKLTGVQPRHFNDVHQYLDERDSEHPPGSDSK